MANGADLDSAGRLVVVRDGERTVVGPLPSAAPHEANILAAANRPTAVGVEAAAIEQGIRSTPSSPWRATPAGSLVGVPVIDDGMAATLSKTAALLRGQPAGSVVLVAGGLNRAGGGLVHAAPEELELLERACDEIAPSGTSGRRLRRGGPTPRTAACTTRRERDRGGRPRGRCGRCSERGRAPGRRARRHLLAALSGLARGSRPLPIAGRTAPRIGPIVTAPTPDGMCKSAQREGDATPRRLRPGVGRQVDRGRRGLLLMPRDDAVRDADPRAGPVGTRPTAVTQCGWNSSTPTGRR